MSSFKYMLLAAVATAGLSMGAASTFAETVSFTTSGAFTSGGNGVAAGDQIVYTSGAATTTLTFNGILVTDTIGTPITASLGSFGISSTGGGATAANGASFTLTITQTVPSGTGSTGGAVTDEFGGKITATTNGFDIVLSPTTLGISGVTYTLQDLDPPTPDTLNVGNGTNVNAKITAVPLPAAAWGGMGLIGLLGAAKARARRQMNG